jgi:hypothetical protein
LKRKLQQYYKHSVPVSQKACWSPLQKLTFWKSWRKQSTFIMRIIWNSQMLTVAYNNALCVLYQVVKIIVTLCFRCLNCSVPIRELISFFRHFFLALSAHSKIEVDSWPLSHSLGTSILIAVAFSEVKAKSKAIPVTGRGGLYGWKMLRIPHCLDNGLTDGSKVVSLTHLPLYSPESLFFCFWYSFLLKAE